MAKPSISFDRSGNTVCGTINLPYDDDDGAGQVQVSGFGINPMTALRKAAEVATRMVQDPEIQALIPPQALIVIKTARALTQLDRKQLEQVARDDQSAQSARKLASVLGELTIGRTVTTHRGRSYEVDRGASRGRDPKRGRPLAQPKRRPKNRRELLNRRYAPPTPQVDQYGNPLDEYGNPLDQYGNPMPTDQYGGYDPNNPAYNPYAELPAPYGYPPPMPYGYGQYYDRYAQPSPDQYFADEYQQAAESFWGANAFAQQDDGGYGGTSYDQWNPPPGYFPDPNGGGYYGDPYAIAGDGEMIDDIAGDGEAIDEGCEPFCGPMGEG